MFNRVVRDRVRLLYHNTFSSTVKQISHVLDIYRGTIEKIKITGLLYIALRLTYFYAFAHVHYCAIIIYAGH